MLFCISENLVHIHDTTASRADLFYLVPENQVSELMVKLMALKATSNIDKLEIKKVWSLPPSFAGTALSEIIFLEDYAECGLQELVNFEGWDVGNAIGIPKCTNSNDSAVWVIQWMDIQEEFTPVVPPKLHEEWTRMYSALDLITGEWNEIRADVDERFQKWWLKLRQSNVY
ncbi:hypothetical protein PIB30_027878 [Stylosanthes scabra]|uniref:Uncharacterized protein n=1 Tax=Stylosanthes scabra TaxID=79078 RepID=A0ABU6XBP0_9FABA|nr:hypothetical protein [Stylosanthes scabra]